MSGHGRRWVGLLSAVFTAICSVGAVSAAFSEPLPGLVAAVTELTGTLWLLKPKPCRLPRFMCLCGSIFRRLLATR